VNGTARIDRFGKLSVDPRSHNDTDSAAHAVVWAAFGGEKGHL